MNFTMDFTMSATVPTAYDVTQARVRELLAEAGFGVLTEIDVAATLRAKLGVEIAPKIILGACRPQLAHQALLADPRMAALMPCNVVVSAVDDQISLVEVLDPGFMATIAPDPDLATVAADARARLAGMLSALEGETDNATGG
jgi:uncharacterized protein (DUF302 family)